MAKRVVATPPPHSNGEVEQKTIDLLTLSPHSNIDALARQVVDEEPLIPENRLDQVKQILGVLQEKTYDQKQVCVVFSFWVLVFSLELFPHNHTTQVFYLFKMLRAHILPLTNCAFNKDGDKFITGSYDRTCKVWDTATGDELVSLEGHKNVVYALSFNTPFGDKVATGSFDKTCKVCWWDVIDDA